MNEHSEKVFLKAIDILNEAGLTYWIEGGTLLGVIRESRLLPWDYDIDFCVWNHENTREDIIQLFTKNGYEYRPVMEPMDCVQFMLHDNRVDISFYTKSEFSAVSMCSIPSKNILKKYFSSLIHLFYENENNLLGKYGNDLSLFKKFVSKFSVLFPNIILIKLYNLAIKCYDSIGFSYSNDLLDFKKIIYKDKKLTVPINSELFLETTYGRDWQTPKKKYDWFDEQKNIVSLKYCKDKIL